jgi:hypothetical protein
MVKLKSIIIEGFAQIKRLWKVLLFLYLPILMLFIVLDVISRSSEKITLSYFTRDVVAIGHLPFFAGLVSQLGGMLWSATLAVCIFTISVLYQRNQEPAARRFLGQASILTTVLLFDDIFLLHEDIGPDYLHIGEKAIVLAYGFLAILFLLYNSREILSSEYIILGLALAMFGMSIFLDAAHLDKYDQYSFIFWEQFQTFLEDGFKFVGIATWLLYFARYSLQRVKALPNP